MIILTAAMTCMALNLYHETRGEPVDGQIAVAMVVLNRVASPNYPDDVCAVVYAPGQFSWTASPPKVTDMLAYSLAELIAKVAIEGGFPNDLSGGATHYFAYDKVTPVWAKTFTPTTQIGGHAFMKEWGGHKR